MLYQLPNSSARPRARRCGATSGPREESSYLSGLIFPDKHLQERYYSILPFLAKHGMGLLDTLYDAIHLDCPDHTILPVLSFPNADQQSKAGARRG